jgi:hypothetical protein
MADFWGAFVTTNGTTWVQNVATNKAVCKEQFGRWYVSVNYPDISVEYALVSVEKDKHAEQGTTAAPKGNGIAGGTS